MVTKKIKAFKAKLTSGIAVTITPKTNDFIVTIGGPNQEFTASFEEVVSGSVVVTGSSGSTVSDQPSSSSSSVMEVSPPSSSFSEILGPAGIRHFYSQLQCWSSDEKFVLLYNPSNDDAKVYDFPGLNMVYDLIGPSAYKWIPGTHKLVSNDSTTIYVHNIDAKTRTPLVTGFQGLVQSMTHEDLSESGIGAFYSSTLKKVYIVDCNNGTVLYQWGLTGNINFIAVTPSAKYVGVQFNNDGTDAGCGLCFYDIATGNFVENLVKDHDHGTWMYDDNFDYWLTSDDTYPTDNNNPGITMHKIGTGDSVELKGDWKEWHFGASRKLNVGRFVVTSSGMPGIYVYDSKNNKMLANAEHNMKTSIDYFWQPQASMSPSGKWIVFASNKSGAYRVHFLPIP